jgi:hypothetical protein
MAPLPGDPGRVDARVARRNEVPTLALTWETLAALGVSRDDLLQPVLSSDATRLLEALLVSRGFDISRAVQVIELTSGAGFVLTQ